MNFIKNNLKNIIIGILLILFIGSLIIIYNLLNKDEENKLVSITGTVIIQDASYVIIEAANDDYLISNIKGIYKVGDTVKFWFLNDDFSKEEAPKKISKVKDEELIKSGYVEEENTSKEEVTNNNSNNKNDINSNTNTDKNTTSNNNNTNSMSNSNFNADTQVLNYFNDLKNNVDGETIKSGIKNGFITIVDFLFYNGKIKGYTFSDLSNSTKLKVLSIALYFDTKIEEYFPGYKESISNTTNKIYTDVKEKIVEEYLDITTTICSTNSESCENAKEGFNKIKINFGLTWNLIKDIAGDGLTKLKDWYEVWSGK